MTAGLSDAVVSDDQNSRNKTNLALLRPLVSNISQIVDSTFQGNDLRIKAFQ